MTYQSQTDINAFFCLVAQQVAGSPRVGLNDYEFKSTSEIMSEMRATHKDLLSLLKIFFLVRIRAGMISMLRLRQAGTLET